MRRVFWGIDYLSAEGAICGGEWDAVHQEPENETQHPPHLHLHSDAKLPRSVSLLSESRLISCPAKAHLDLPNLRAKLRGEQCGLSLYGQSQFNRLRHGML